MVPMNSKSPIYRGLRRLLHLVLSAFRSILRFVVQLLYPSILTEPLTRVTYDRPYDHTLYIDPVTGTFPSKPLPHLPPPFKVYEDLLDVVTRPDSLIFLGEDESELAVSQRPAAEKWRADVRAIPTQDFSPLRHDRPSLQRAHTVLAWLVHFYVHSTAPAPNKVIVIPACLAVPLVHVSQWLGIAPILTYADTVLWNAEMEDASLGFSPNNLRFAYLFGANADVASDETEFYRCCAWIEWRALECTKRITRLVQDVQKSDRNTEQAVSDHLRALAPIVSELTEILMAVKTSCRPNAFYNSIRPWYRGSDAEGDGPRWVYEGVEDFASLELSGPSAGQTCVFHMLDAILGVEHGERSKPFMDRMLLYMPSEQREMINHLKLHSHCIRSMVDSSDQVREAYNAVVDAMTKFRSGHLQVAVRYVISPKDKCPMSGLSAVQGKSRGTGGNELSTMLKGSRDSTRNMIA